MSMANDLINLRKRVSDAVKLGVVDEADKSIYEATLIQILNESERQRIRCVNLAEDFKRKVAQSEAQASAYSQISSIIYNVINGFVVLAEKGQAEEAQRLEERAETASEQPVEKSESEDPKPKKATSRVKRQSAVKPEAEPAPEKKRTRRRRG